MEMRSWEELWVEETVARSKIDPAKLCDFGIKPLDDALIGLLPNDLVVIGADSGVGKSHMALNIALHNAMKGKTVALYFIEGGAEEAIIRIKWTALCNLYFSKYWQEGIDMDFRLWRMNKIKESEFLAKIEMEALWTLQEKIGDRLQIYSFTNSFTITDLTYSLGWFIKPEVKEESGVITQLSKYEVDLIIVDHLQYFTLTNPQNELQEMTSILMKVKDITNFKKIPVIMISHLRKKDKDRGLPSQEDFYGTSNIAKISSIAITVMPHYAQENYRDDIYPTFFRIVKSRTGIRSTYAILCNFDLRLDQYESQYGIYRLAKDVPVKDPIDETQLPKWARKIKQQQPPPPPMAENVEWEE